MTQEYGDPKAGDATAQLFDSRVNRVGADIVRRIARGSNLVNRKPGSKVMSKRETKEEYAARFLGNPEAKQQKLVELMTQLGVADGVGEYVSWIKSVDPAYEGE